MRGRILSFRWWKLTRIGFVVDDRFIGLRKFQGWLGGVFRHPAALVLLGFVLTGVIGNYLAQLENERKQQSDAVVKGMDEIRASFDDLSVGFSDFQFRTNRLIKLEEAEASSDEIATARAQYDEAVQKWKDHLVADGPRIGGLYSQMTGYQMMGFPVSHMNIDTEYLDACLSRNIREQGSDPRDISLTCINKASALPNATSPGVTVESRMWILSTCVQYFTEFMRPDPQFDFQRDGLRANPHLKFIEVICDPQREFESLQKINEVFTSEFSLPNVPVPNASPAATTGKSR
jgi:hypothetical protein